MYAANLLNIFRIEEVDSVRFQQNLCSSVIIGGGVDTTNVYACINGPGRRACWAGNGEEPLLLLIIVPPLRRQRQPVSAVVLPDESMLLTVLSAVVTAVEHKDLDLI